MQNDSMICTLNCLALKSDVIIAGCKNGKISFVNIRTG